MGLLATNIFIPSPPLYTVLHCRTPFDPSKRRITTTEPRILLASVRDIRLVLGGSRWAHAAPLTSESKASSHLQISAGEGKQFRGGHPSPLATVSLTPVTRVSRLVGRCHWAIDSHQETAQNRKKAGRRRRPSCTDTS